MSAPDLNKKVKEMQKELTKLVERTLPVKVGVAAVNHVKDNFRQGGSDGNKWEDPHRRKLGFAGAKSSYGTLLSGKNALMNRTQRNIGRGHVRVFNNAEYALIHNQGGNITVTAKMKKFFWARHIEAQGGIRTTKTGKKSKSKRNVALSNEAEFWRNMALKKVGSQIKMPKRKFMGDSKLLNRNVKSVIDKELTNFINKWNTSSRT